MLLELIILGEWIFLKKERLYFALSQRIIERAQVKELSVPQIDYQIVHERIAMARSASKEFLMMEMNLLEEK